MIRCLIGCAVSYQLNTRHFGAFYAIRSKTASLASARISIQRSRRFTLVLRKIHPKLLPFVPIKQRIIRNDGANNYYNCFIGTNKLSKKLGRISRLSFFDKVAVAPAYPDGRARIHPAGVSFRPLPCECRSTRDRSSSLLRFEAGENLSSSGAEYVEKALR